MKGKGVALSLVLLLTAPAYAQSGLGTPKESTGLQKSEISGEYVEFRTADVYTGPCTANGEMNLTGQEAVLAWHIAEGQWNGVPLGGLGVVAVVRANATLGDAFANPLPAKTVFLVDERANAAQRAALVNFAQAQTAGLLDDVVAVEAVAVQFGATSHGAVTLQAGNLAAISTRALNDGDKFCHNESVYYQPLASNLHHAMPAMVTAGIYSGNHLGKTWTERGRRGAFVGSFSL